VEGLTGSLLNCVLEEALERRYLLSVDDPLWQQIIRIYQATKSVEQSCYYKLVSDLATVLYVAYLAVDILVGSHGHLGLSWGHHGVVLGTLGAVLGPSWAVLGRLGAMLGHLGTKHPTEPKKYEKKTNLGTLK
jgi:hypothetical protein